MSSAPCQGKHPATRTATIMNLIFTEYPFLDSRNSAKYTSLVS